MATLYTKRGIWYISVSVEGNRQTRSLYTKDNKVAQKLKPLIELEILQNLTGITQKTRNIPFDELVRIYLIADHNWSQRTKELNTYVFNSYLSGKPLLNNPTSRAIFVRTINACWNWGLKQGLVKKAFKLEGDTKGESSCTHGTYFDGRQNNSCLFRIYDWHVGNWVRIPWSTTCNYSLYGSKGYENN